MKKKRFLKVLVLSLALFLILIDIVLYLNKDWLNVVKAELGEAPEMFKQNLSVVVDVVTGKLNALNESVDDKHNIAARISNDTSSLEMQPLFPAPSGSNLASNDSVIANPGVVGNQWLSVIRYPVSNFSMEVDGSNFNTIKDILAHGIVPPRSVIKIESLINYFDFYYKQNTDDRILVNYEIAESPLEQDIFILKLSLKMRPFDPARDQKDWNVFFAIENSAQMNDIATQMELIKAVKGLAGSMAPRDKIGLTVFNGDQQLILGQTKGKDRTKILRVLNGVKFSGGVQNPVHDFLNRAVSVVSRNKDDKSLNKIIVFTNGDLKLLPAELENIKNQRNILLHILSLKKNPALRIYYDNLNPEYHVRFEEIENLNDFVTLVNKNFVDDSYEMSAKDLISRIKFNGALVSWYRLIGFSNIDAGMLENISENLETVDLKYNAAATILYKLRLNTQRIIAKEEQVGELEMSYTDPKTGEDHLFNRRLNYYKDNIKISDDFNFAIAVAATGEYLSKLDGSENVELSAIKGLAQSNKGKDANGKRQQFIDLLDNIGGVR